MGFSPRSRQECSPRCRSRSGTTTRRFVGHTKDVLSVAFSSDNRQIVSGSRDKTIKLWNTLGVCKYTVQVSQGELGADPKGLGPVPVGLGSFPVGLGPISGNPQSC